MKNDLDAFEDDIATRIASRGLGNNLRAGSGGTAATIAVPTSTRVIDGAVKERWLIGDPFDSDRYYFEDGDL